MAVDILGRDQTHKPTEFKTIDTAVLTVSNGGGGDVEEFLIQNFAFNYTSDVSQIFEIGSTNTYTLPGRARGQFQLGRIIGSRNIQAVLGDFGQGVWQGDGCNDTQIITFTISSICPNAGAALSYDLSGVTVNNYGISSNANQLIIQENISGIFTSLTSGGPQQ